MTGPRGRMLSPQGPATGVGAQGWGRGVAATEGGRIG